MDGEFHQRLTQNFVAEPIGGIKASILDGASVADALPASQNGTVTSLVKRFTDAPPLARSCGVRCSADGGASAIPIATRSTSGPTKRNTGRGA
jgi:hypothetical protein